MLLIGFSKGLAYVLLSAAVKSFTVAMIVTSLEADSSLYLCGNHSTVWDTCVLSTCLVHTL